MNIIQLLQDYNIDYSTSGAHTSRGWVNVVCPWCSNNGSIGQHMGIHLSANACNCWKCGSHKIVLTIASIINESEAFTATLLKRYVDVSFTKESVVKSAQLALIKPSGLTSLTANHKKYLFKRGFDADELESKWKLQSTGVLSRVGSISYKHRIYIPYFWNNELVTFDSRDVTNQSMNKYQACPVDREVMHRKSILYGNQSAWTDVGICVEGCADVWRFGDLAFATSGITFTSAQVRLIAKTFKTVYIVYDYEVQAQVQARKLKAELRMRGVKAEVIGMTNGDPAEMTKNEADTFIKNLLK